MEKFNLPEGHPLKPLESIIHEELSLDEIESLDDGICIIGYIKSNDPKNPAMKLEYETMNSAYVKSYFKELIGTGRILNYDRFRIYRECSTFFEARDNSIQDELKDYIIPQDHLDFRNCDSKYHDIDENGEYVKSNIRYTICVKGLKGYNDLTREDVIEKYISLCKTYKGIRYIIMTSDFSYIHSGNMDIDNLSIISDNMLNEERENKNG